MLPSHDCSFLKALFILVQQKKDLKLGNSRKLLGSQLRTLWSEKIYQKKLTANNPQKDVNCCLILCEYLLASEKKKIIHKTHTKLSGIF